MNNFFNGEVARRLLNKEPGVFQFISCSACGNVLSVNSSKHNNFNCFTIFFN